MNSNKKIYHEHGKKIGCLGLSADPPHCGHLAIARLLLKKKLVDEVWLIPCYEHSFGKLLCPSKHRWEMTKLLEESGIKACDIEILRKGKSYTADTVRILKEKYRGYQFFWVLGSDIVKSGSYKKWKDWQGLSLSVNFLIISRPGFIAKELPSGFILVEGSGSDISSTEIRKRIGRGLPIDNLVTPRIKKYIKKHNLYI